ncbi:hypothetical protein Y5S_03169 [Alcanivorax nanhaiticus]|uniref:YqcC-like domain-containing protein n=1 Tax=Alcanivorax nanhaiticus TaxID=1177154 RepID=A0A095TM60_9GAMM|nr:YqcC family protein [Alcanivorax nanhaiticus]KGD63533.1 hypothetical protein Y5S_03169 [Alcanivorax nanhaiticus]
MTRQTALTTILDDLQAELEKQGLWSAHPPAPSAFESQTPFFADTMDFSEWLQWVFVARFRAMMDANAPLPGSCDVAPMAEEALKEMEQDVSEIISLLKAFDEHF